MVWETISSPQEARLGVVPLADPAFGLLCRQGGVGRVGDLAAKGAVEEALLQPAAAAGRRADRGLGVAVQRVPGKGAAVRRRLVDLGVPEFLARDVLRGVLGQRLGVVACPACGRTGCEDCGRSGAAGRRVEAELWLG